MFKWSSAGSWRYCATVSSSRSAELNTAIGLLLNRLNQKPLKKVPGSLRSAYETIDQPALQALPEHAEWTPQRLIRRAEQTGPNTAGVVAHILERRVHPQHGFRACLGILRRAVCSGACSYKSRESILRQGLEHLPLAQQNLPLLPDEHINLRGLNYYH